MEIYFLLTAIWLVTMAKALVMGVCLNGGDVITDIYSGVILMMQVISVRAFQLLCQH